MHDLPSFDEVYVISDLHMGGAPGFQMLGQVERLARFIEALAQVRPGEQVALVLNGDVIDSLAEDVGYVATQGAVAMMSGIDRRFGRVWDALATFVAAPGRHLVVISGNHDIELALPGVERWVRRRVTGGNTSREAALTFSTHGAGYTCLVGHARVLCTHGNEVDPWNMIDHHQLAQLANALNAGRDIDPERWIPNAGTKLVVEVMNELKRRYPFVDLLKPEDKLVVPVLAVLAPSEVRRVKLRTSLEIAWRKHKGDVAARKLLGHDEGSRSVDGELAVLHGYEPNDSKAWLLEIERAIRDGKTLPDLDDDDDETLGVTQLALDRILGYGEVTSLRNALRQWLVDDTTFALDHRDDTFRRILARTGPSTDFIVTGHTHLERAIPLGGGRMYYNSGTWARLLRLHERHLATDDAFARVLQALRSSSVEALDSAEIDGARLALDRSTAIRMGTTSGGTRSELLHVTDDGAKGITWTPVPNSEGFKR